MQSRVSINVVVNVVELASICFLLLVILSMFLVYSNMCVSWAHLLDLSSCGYLRPVCCSACATLVTVSWSFVTLPEFFKPVLFITTLDRFACLWLLNQNWRRMTPLWPLRVLTASGSFSTETLTLRHRLMSAIILLMRHVLPSLKIILLWPKTKKTHSGLHEICVQHAPSNTIIQPPKSNTENEVIVSL